MIDVFICIIGIPVLLMILLGSSAKDSASQWNIKKMEDREDEIKREFGSDDIDFFESFKEDLVKRLQDADEVEKIYQEIGQDLQYAFGPEYRSRFHLWNERIVPGYTSDTAEWALYLLLAKSGRWKNVGYLDHGLEVGHRGDTTNPYWRKKLAFRVERYLRQVDPEVAFVVRGKMDYDIHAKPTGKIFWNTGTLVLTDPSCVPSNKTQWLYKRLWSDDGRINENM